MSPDTWQPAVHVGQSTGGDSSWADVRPAMYRGW
jgi:hypothetical protein